MSHTLTLPEDLYRALVRYAEQQRQTPEGALASLLQGIPALNGSAAAETSVPEEEAGTSGSAAPVEYLDPWEGFRGKFEAKYPDLIERHDYYIGQAALDTHEDEGDDE